MIVLKKFIQMGSLTVLSFALCFSWCNLHATKANAQAQKAKESVVQPSPEKTLGALLEELRNFRRSFERTNLGVFRAQILVGRIRIQQDRVDRINQQLEELRTQSADNKVNQSRLQDRLKELDSRISQERDSSLRAQFESEQKEMKFLLEQQTGWEERQRERENQLSVQMQLEQDQLRRLNDRLDALEREFESQSPAATSK